MGAHSGPNYITNGTKFCFDFENTVKSWKGKPTSNLAVGKFFDGNGNFTTDVTIQDELPDGSIGDVRYLNADYVYDPNRTVTVGNYNLTAGETYTLSFYVKNINCTGFAGNLYSPGLGRVLDQILYPTIYTDRWTRVIKTFTVPVEGVDPVLFFPQAFRDGGNGFFKMCWLQMEQGDVATRYIDGVRLDTASIVDISKTKSTITAANLTYRQDDSPTFDGTDDYFSTGTPDITNSSFTIESFVKPSAISRYNPIIGDYQYDWFGLYFDVNNNITSMHRQASGQDNRLSYGLSSSLLAADKWISVVSVFDITAGKKIYVNGANVISNTNTFSWTVDPSTGRGPQYIGRHARGTPGTPDYFYGEISQVRLYDRALSADEVKQNFDSMKRRYDL